MKKTVLSRLWALLLALLLPALPAALAEEAEIVSQPVEEAVPATDAGDTGLWVEDAAPLAREREEIELTEEGEAPAGAGEVLSEAWATSGYAAVADGTAVYADAASERLMGTFPRGAVVWVDSLTDDGAMLKIRFDTDEARSGGTKIPEGYVPAENALRLTEDELKALKASLKADENVRDGAPLAVLDAAGYGVSADAEEEETEEEAEEPEPTVQGLAVTARTQAQIQAFVDAHPSYSAQINIYTVPPSDDPYAIGRLSSVNQYSALNMLNQMRYIAGLNANLKLLPEREEMEASAALVLKLFGGLSHYPTRPAALAGSQYDSLYSLGYSGAGRSNIAMGYTVTAAIPAYMADNDSENIQEVGHRRWILNPPMGRTVAGANGRFSAMYAHDQSGTGAQTRVAWPAQQMPVQYFSAQDPWSVSFGAVLESSQIEVDLVRQWDKKAWHFSEAKSDGFFTVDNRAFGQRGCVIFRPDDVGGIMIGDEFEVSIANHADNTVTRYTVRFFSLDMTASAALSRPEVTAVKTDKGNKISWTAVERATGYYVCRRNPDGMYAVVADVSGALTYLDSKAQADTEYYYQVYPHTKSVTCPLMSGVQAKAPEPEKIKLNVGKTVKLYEGDTLQLKQTLVPAVAETGLFWSSMSEWVATVTQEGLVTAQEKGVTTITVTTDNQKQARVKVQVMARTSLEKAKVAVGNRTYNGKARKPAVKVTVGKKTLTKGTDYTVAYSGNTRVGIATVTITGKGKYKDTVTATFQIKPVKVAGLKLKRAESGRLAVSWKKAEGISGYEIQYGTRSSFRGAKKITVKKTAVSTTLKKLKSGKTYYVRIRSYKTAKGTKVYSAWSAAASKKVR